MAGTRDQYAPASTRAALRLLVQLAYDLHDRLDQIVFVGGMACVLLFPQDTDPHAGTKDIDLALDPARLPPDADETLEDVLMNNLYQQHERKQYRWDRAVSMDGDSVRVEIDLLACEYADDGRVTTPARPVQGVAASVLRGVDLAFIQPVLRPIAGVLLDGRPFDAEVQVCNAASLLVMKGIAIADRPTGADKDADDIDYILRRYSGGPQALADILQSVYYTDNDLVTEGLRGLAAAFRDIDAFGPRSIASEERIPAPEVRAQERQRTVQRVRRLLRALDFSG